MKCSICKEKISPDPNGWSEGHNAKPVNEVVRPIILGLLKKVSTPSTFFIFSSNKSV